MFSIFRKNTLGIAFLILLSVAILVLYERQDSFIENVQTNTVHDNPPLINTLNNPNTVLNKYAADLIRHLDYFDRSQEVCNNLLKDWTTFEFTKEFEIQKNRFEFGLKENMKGNKPEEGHSGLVKEKQYTLHHFAKHPAIKTVCETGFNYGHSSYNFLSANPNIKVRSFDLGKHAYAERMSKTLMGIFTENRVNLTLGSSDKTIPKAIQRGEVPLCDLIYVDGGHIYPVALADIVNLASHASPVSLIVFDDYPTDWGMSFGKAWEESILPGKLRIGESIDVEKIRNELNENIDRSTFDATNLSDLKKTFKIKELIRCRIVGGEITRGFVVGLNIRV